MKEKLKTFEVVAKTEKSNAIDIFIAIDHLANRLQKNNAGMFFYDCEVFTNYKLAVYTLKTSDLFYEFFKRMVNKTYPEVCTFSEKGVIM